MTTWVYKQTEFGEYPLWTVGFFCPLGNWHPESDHATSEAASKRVHYLNGGKDVHEETKQLTSNTK